MNDGGRDGSSATTATDGESMANGVLYGIGVGPGDPELLVLKAVRILGAATTVFAAASTKNESSACLDVVREHINPNARIVRLGFPMTRDEAVLDAALTENARVVLAALKDGDAACLTLGDPCLYSTFGRLLPALKGLDPEVRVELVPGIPSFLAAAAKTGTMLAQGDEHFCLISGAAPTESFLPLLDRADSAAIIKTYRNAPAILEAVTDRFAESIYAARLGSPGEVILPAAKAPRTSPYMALVLARGRRRTTPPSKG